MGETQNEMSLAESFGTKTKHSDANITDEMNNFPTTVFCKCWSVVGSTAFIRVIIKMDLVLHVATALLIPN